MSDINTPGGSDEVDALGGIHSDAPVGDPNQPAGGGDPSISPPHVAGGDEVDDLGGNHSDDNFGNDELSDHDVTRGDGSNL